MKEIDEIRTGKRTEDRLGEEGRGEEWKGGWIDKYPDRI
jgi:hypothetical protein